MSEEDGPGGDDVELESRTGNENFCLRCIKWASVYTLHNTRTKQKNGNRSNGGEEEKNICLNQTHLR